jgi:hypothetical protein
MAVNVCLPLFGNAGHELEEGKPLRSSQLRTLANDLAERLLQLADLLDRLHEGGWSATTAMYDAFLVHPEVNTRAEAEAKLTSLGLDPALFMIVEEVDEEDLA